MIWSRVMGVLQQYNLCTQKDVVASFGEAIPRKIRNIFYYYYYHITNQQEAASQALAGLKPFVGKDFRFDMCRRNLLLAAGQESEALDGLKPESLDSHQRVLFYNLWLAYWEKCQWTHRTVSSYEGFLAALAEVTAPILSSTQIATNENYLIGRWASNLAKRQLPQHAIILLEAHLERIDAINLRLLASLYIASNEYSKAISVMEKQLGKSPANERQEIVRRILDYSVLTNNSRIVQRYVSEAERLGMTSIVEEYQRVIALLGPTENVDRRILNAPGHFLCGDTDWRHWEGFGPCAVGSAFSVIRFWKKDVKYVEVLTGLSKLQSEGKYPLATLTEYFGTHGLSLAYMVHTRTAAVSLLSRGVPAILLDTTLIDGITFRHASVMYAYDDRLEKVFLRNTSDLGENRLEYADLPEATVMAVVMPRSSFKDLISDNLKCLVIPSLCDALSPDTISRLASIDPLLEYWAYRHNGNARLKLQDATSSIDWYEKCMRIKEPSASSFYEDLALVCIRNKQEDKAAKYVKRGMKKEPRNLLLLRYQIQMRRDVALETGTLDSALTHELIALTRRMETINPDYPFTYFLRGDLYVRGLNRAQPALTAFLQFLEKYQHMNESWKQEHKYHRTHAQNAIKLCHNSLASLEK